MYKKPLLSWKSAKIYTFNSKSGTLNENMTSNFRSEIYNYSAFCARAVKI